MLCPNCGLQLRDYCFFKISIIEVCTFEGETSRYLGDLSTGLNIDLNSVQNVIIIKSEKQPITDSVKVIVCRFRLEIYDKDEIKELIFWRGKV